MKVPADTLRLRLDFYTSSIVATSYDKETTKTRLVSPQDIALAIHQRLPVNSGLLPPEALWWQSSSEGPMLALWRPPQKWRVALLLKVGEPAQRFHLPMPGLIWLVTPARPPWVFPALKRPKKPSDKVFRAPLFNVYSRGLTCLGTHNYPDDLTEIPESFMTAFFAPTGDTIDRSKKHPKWLGDWWKELDGTEEYPTDDLVPHGTVKDLLEIKS